MPTFGEGTHWEPNVGELVVVPVLNNPLYPYGLTSIMLSQEPENTSSQFGNIEVPCSKHGALGISIGIWPSYDEWPRPLGLIGLWRPVSVLVLLGDTLGWIALQRVKAIK